MVLLKFKARFTGLIHNIAKHNLFFVLVLTIVTLQGLWYVFMYQPGLFDERYHLDFIRFYSAQLDPFVNSQSSLWDSLGDVTRQPSYLFHYIMSFPYRLISNITSNEFIQIQSIRVLMLLLFLFGLYNYRKLITRLTGSIIIAHISLLIFSIIPAYAFFGAVINYDIVIFTMFPILINWLFDLLEKEKADIFAFAKIFALGCVGVLVKVSFMPIFATVLIVAVFVSWRNFGLKYINYLYEDCIKKSVVEKFLIVLMIIVPLALIIERPVYNQFKFGKVAPSCMKMLPVNRCMKNYTAARSIEFTAQKPTHFTPAEPTEYFFNTWIVGMTRTQIKVDPAAKAFPILLNTFYIFNILIVFLIVAGVKLLAKKMYIKIVLSIVLIYTLLLFIDNYSAFVRLGKPVAINARYILLFMPILIAVAGLGYREFLKKWPNLRVALVSFFVILVATQGGGMIGQLMSGNKVGYWPNTYTVRLNDITSPIAKKIVIERSFFGPK